MFAVILLDNCPTCMHVLVLTCTRLLHSIICSQIKSVTFRFWVSCTDNCTLGWYYRIPVTGKLWNSVYGCTFKVCWFSRKSGWVELVWLFGGVNFPLMISLSVYITCCHGSILLWWQCNTLFSVFTSGFVDTSCFHIIQGIDQNQRWRISIIVQFARWRHRGRSLPSLTASVSRQLCPQECS